MDQPAAAEHQGADVADKFPAGDMNAGPEQPSDGLVEEGNIHSARCLSVGMLRAQPGCLLMIDRALVIAPFERFVVRCCIFLTLACRD